MIDSKLLLADLKKQVKLLESDLRNEAKNPSGDESERWAKDLREEHLHAREHKRTARMFDDWLEGEVSQAAVAWIVASVFIRFCEDNALLNGLWIAGSADRTQRATEAEMAHYASRPTDNARDWLRTAFGSLADLPAGRALVDRQHNLVWRAPISAESASALLKFWRQTDDSGALVHDFTDPDFGTRFVGDLYQDLSDYAKKTFALLQTPDFIEEFVLDQTLTPAINEFGIVGLKLIDPTCGSGHFLLGAFARLHREWESVSPGLSQRQRVQNALDSIHGVDLNPFAVAIARFRLTVAALRACGESSLVTAPAFAYHLAVGDSLIGEQGRQGDLFDDAQEPYAYASEDFADYKGILTPGTYHVVVGNPPYITVKDKALNEWYRRAYETCAGKYALSVPFMELFFRLAIRGSSDTAAGHVGQITSNSFMKREFGKKLIEELLSGKTISNPVDLTHIIDTSGAYIPGHGTPTVILVGRRRAPVGSKLRAVMGMRGEPGQPKDPAKGKVWTEIVRYLNRPDEIGDYVESNDVDRSKFASHPWSLSGGSATDIYDEIRTQGLPTVEDISDSVGIVCFTLEDEVFIRPSRCFVADALVNSVPIALGDGVRDYRLHIRNNALFPYDQKLKVIDIKSNPDAERTLWPFRSNLSNNIMFNGATKVKSGLKWYEFGRLTTSKFFDRNFITFAEVATHNHFFFSDRRIMFKQTAPVIKLPRETSKDAYVALTSILNSSMTCFLLRQVSYPKDRSNEAWETRFAFNSSNVGRIPIPWNEIPSGFGSELQMRISALDQLDPAKVLSDYLKSEKPGSLMSQLEAARERWKISYGELVFLSEELDWKVYELYGLTSAGDLAFEDINPIGPGERACDLNLARQVASGETDTDWFREHGVQPITDIPSTFSAPYAAVVSRRLQEIDRNPRVRELERPEFKRRWASDTWEDLQRDAIRALALDRLEKAEVWQDAMGASCKSVAQLADSVRHDPILAEALEMLAGSSYVELVPALTSLLSEESVPYLAQLRYKEAGLTSYRGWQAVWNIQRRQDAGEMIDAPVPPIFKRTDFQKPSYWQARGKLDVPKERFISYPGLLRSGDTTPIFGWARWDHAAAAQALARALAELDAEGATQDQLIPILAGLHEIEPWVVQWHSDVDPAIGSSPAAGITGMLDGYLSRLGLTRADLENWRPAVSPARRPRRNTASIEDQEIPT